MPNQQENEMKSNRKEWSTTKESVYRLLDETDGFMCRDGLPYSDILKELMNEGWAECEIRVSIPTYWRKI